MNAQQIADDADMIVAGYAYKNKGDYIEVIDLSDINKISTIQNEVVSESVMSDEDDEVVLRYYLKNKEILEESLNA